MTYFKCFILKMRLFYTSNSLRAAYLIIKINFYDILGGLFDL